MEKVEVTEHKESAGISDAAIADIPASIVESQSLNVDTVSGATHTSDAILDAVKAALTEAGADVEALMSGEGAAKTTVTLEDKTYDVVVLGAGGEGLSAAIEAQAAGANVVVIEKDAVCRRQHNSVLCRTGLPEQLAAQEETGREDSPELMAKEMWEGGGKVAKKEMVDIVANNATAAAEWLRDEIGVKYQDYLVREGRHSVARAVEPIDLGPGMINPLKEYEERSRRRNHAEHESGRTDSG